MSPGHHYGDGVPGGDEAVQSPGARGDHAADHHERGPRPPDRGGVDRGDPGDEGEDDEE
jgi:hypothetical protein